MDEQIGETGPDVTWEEFRAQAYKEPFENGVYIVNGDEPLQNEKQLREFYDYLYTDNELIVNRVGGTDDKWSNTAKLNITYCVSNTFNNNKATVVNAMNAATGQWEAAANVNFVYRSEFDASCTASQSGVVFDVRPVNSGGQYLARAFFPSQGRSTRNVLIDGTAFNSGWSLTNILVHELGHTLGFRHEHTRPEAGTCFEDNNWRSLTPYDSSSTMHYPQCNGTSSNLAMTNTDRQGAASLYGAPGQNPDPDPDPDPDPGCTPTSGSASGSVARNQNINYNPLPVAAGSTFRVVMSGSGDPDLYVRFGAAPTLSQFNCRPYLNGANETCNLTVPSGQSQAYIMVRGYTAATYTINVNWCQP
jgi:hypothetical protein